jgi:hypothetical protein
MRVAQFYFTKKLYKCNENIFSKNNPTQYITTQLSTYYFWWGYQNFFKKKTFIINNSIINIQKNIYIYQI